MQDLDALHTLVINSLEEQIAVIDEDGIILDVNDSWTRFGVENGLAAKYAWVGSNYLTVLSASAAGGDVLAREAAEGIREVMSGMRPSFYFEYPCHSPDEQRWFMMRVTPLQQGARRMFAISHYNITLRKLAEERTEYLSLHDSLTGLANRRYFNLFLNREMRKSVRSQSMISLISIDIDHFKEYNDQFGHLAGDQCLTNVAQVLQGYSRRPGDLVARLGGDEFALILADTGIAESRQLAEGILQAILDLRMVLSDAMQITASIGVVSLIPHEQQNENFLLQEADKALYQAKMAGRNRVVHASLPISIGDRCCTD